MLITCSAEANSWRVIWVVDWLAAKAISTVEVAALSSLPQKPRVEDNLKNVVGHHGPFEFKGRAMFHQFWPQYFDEIEIGHTNQHSPQRIVH